MCGLAGIWHRNGQPASEAALRRMLGEIAHRGRDGCGLFIDGDLGLAHNRMRVIDLSDNANQPMSDPEGRYQLVYNGEIHNYTELRQALRHSWQFRTGSDTEVVLAAWAQWGADCFNRFNGMWALALWDSRRRQLVLSRDRFGIKPLFYSLRGQRLAFASEAKALLAISATDAEPDYRQVYGYLTTAATNMHGRTFHRHIRSLQPGTLLSISGDSVETSAWWDFEPGRESTMPDTVERFRELMIDATRIRLRSDVPLASWVSGGLDSSLVTRIAGSLLDKPLQCYSLRYPRPQDDESAYAEQVVDDPTRYRMQWVTPSDSDPLAVMERVVRHHDGPTPVRGRYAQWHIAAATTGNQVVVLNGDGADELLAGYGFFAAPYTYDRLLNPANHRHDELSLRVELGRLAEVQGRSRRAMAKMLASPLLFRLGIRYRGHVDIMTPDFVHQHGFWDASQHQAGWACRGNHAPFSSHLNNALWHEFRVRGLPENLHGTDAISMAHTLEVRSPFLDHRLVEFCFSLPYYRKIGDGLTKVLMRRAFPDTLPPQVLNRREKFGFRSPVLRWLHRPGTFAHIRDFLLEGECVRNGLFDRTRLETALDKLAHWDGSGDRDSLWRWCSLEFWWRQSQGRQRMDIPTDGR